MVISLLLFFALAWWLGLYLLYNHEATAILRGIAVASLLSALLLASQVILPNRWAWLLVGMALADIVAGILFARRNASGWGEAFLPDFFRSLDAAIFSTLLFAAPVALTMLFSTGDTLAMRTLLLCTIALAIATQVFAEPLQSLLDRLAILALPLRSERAELRSLADALPRIDPSIEPLQLPEAEFIRLTRRALSQYGDLAGLSTNPLTRLPVVERRLKARNASGHTLERANELKALLLEAILHLKPAAAVDFDSSDGWRHYNSLYFPYVVGLRPYNNRSETPSLDNASRRALEWLRAQVPQRTLHNWQNSAARLVALYLREVEK